MKHLKGFSSGFFQRIENAVIFLVAGTFLARFLGIKVAELTGTEPIQKP